MWVELCGGALFQANFEGTLKVNKKGKTEPKYVFAAEGLQIVTCFIPPSFLSLSFHVIYAWD